MYFKKITFFIVAAGMCFSCKTDPPSAQKTTTPPPAQTQSTSNKTLNDQTSAQTKNQPSVQDKMAELRANSFDENDTFGRVNHSIGQVQKQFVISNQLDTPKGKQSISIDEQFDVIVRSEVDGKVYDTKVNLKNLDQRNGMRLIPNRELDELPGFGISVIDGKPGVEIIENGKVVREERELQIYMADRSLIEQAVPAFLQALNVVHGRI